MSHHQPGTVPPFPTRPRSTTPALTLLLAAAVACGSPETTTAPTDTPLASRFGGFVPSAPAQPVATAGVNQATIAWQAPTNTGRGRILYYWVSAVGINKRIKVTAPATSTAFPDLTAGTPVSFTVVAVNLYGSSPASAKSNSVTPATTSSPPPPPPSSPPPSGSSRWVSGYWVGYQRSLYPETAVDFSLLTHIIVGSIEPTASGDVDKSMWLDPVTGPTVAKTLSTRAHQAGRKAILMLGGSGYHDVLVSVTSSSKRASFVSKLLTTLDELGYDGLDIDWEPISTSDEPQLIAFLQALRAARPSIILTIPVPWINANAPSMSTFYQQAAGVVDQMNLMSYDMAANWQGWDSWHFSALYDHAPTHPSDISSSIQAYLSRGIAAAKLGIGLGFYGSCWRGVTGPRQAITGNVSLGGSDNTMSYATIMKSYYSAAVSKWDGAAQVPYLSSTAGMGPQGCNFVSYEDPQSIAAKGAYVKSKGLGGAIIWTIGQGRVATAPAGQQDPLMAAAYNSIVP